MTSNDSETTKVGSARKSPVKRHARFNDERIGLLLLDLRKNIGWNKNASVNWLRIRTTESGWQVVIKARRGQDYGVAYLDASTFEEALELLATMAYDDDLRWRDDSFPHKV